MKRLLLSAAIGALLLAGCSKVELRDADAPAQANLERSAAPTPASLPKLTYRYAYGLEAPSDRLRGLVDQHESACADAGPAVCQVLAVELREVGRHELRGELKLRATPEWLKAFRSGLAEQVKAAGGKIAASSVGTDDLARPIVDAQARLKAKMLARDRLQALVASKAGSLEELRQMREALDATQAEVEAIAGELEGLRTQVQMHDLSLSYAPPGVLSPQGAWSPLGKAAEQSAASVAFTLSMVLQMMIWVGPWALIAILGFAGYRRFRPKSDLKPAAGR